MKNNRKGFTMAELLIVVAIIAVLVAVAIPTFSAQLEKSRRATDAANIRSSYAEAMANYLMNEENGKGSSFHPQSKTLKNTDEASALPENLDVTVLPETWTKTDKYQVTVTAQDDDAPEVKLAKVTASDPNP